jgi:hypothetical protein
MAFLGPNEPPNLPCVDCLEEVDADAARVGVFTTDDAAGKPIHVCYDHFIARQAADEREAERRLSEKPNGL